MLINTLKRTRREFYFHIVPQRIGCQAFGVDVGKPCASGFVFRMRDVVSVLFGFAVEEAELGTAEGSGDFG